mmetsp:Transcript_10826/g.31007  ORF Transcript_10826/g.31007 Transcript_10826/m.31007 type:complete len:157 (-) Transcript_10826:421-891(-)
MPLAPPVLGGPSTPLPTPWLAPTCSAGARTAHRALCSTHEGASVLREAPEPLQRPLMRPHGPSWRSTCMVLRGHGHTTGQVSPASTLVEASAVAPQCLQEALHQPESQFTDNQSLLHVVPQAVALLPVQVLAGLDIHRKVLLSDLAEFIAQNLSEL